MTTIRDPDGLACYSDHFHDIETAGSCLVCGSNDLDVVGHVLPHIERLKGVDPVNAAALVLSTKSAKLIDGVLLDMFTASAIQTVYDAVSDDSKAMLRSVSLPQAAAVCWKAVR